MLKHISIHQLQMGMYIHQFCGSWLDHSFWKAGFVLDSRDDLQRLQRSNLSTLWIDTAKGRDLPEASPAPAPSAPPPPLPLPPLQPASTTTPRVSMDEEVQRALKLCADSRKAVMAMFQEVRMGQALHMHQAEELVLQMRQSLLRHPDALISLARLKSADDYTYMHSVCGLRADAGHRPSTGLVGGLHPPGGDCRAAA
jgi:hypothetical protein